MANVKVSDEEFGRMCERLNEIDTWPSHPGLRKEVLRYRETGLLSSSRLEQIDRILNHNQQLGYDDWASLMADRAINAGESPEPIKNELTSIQSQISNSEVHKKIVCALDLPFADKENVIRRLSSNKIRGITPQTFLYSEDVEPARDVLVRHPEIVDYIVKSVVMGSTKKTVFDMAREVFAALTERFEQYPGVDSHTMGRIMWML